VLLFLHKQHKQYMHKYPKFLTNLDHPMGCQINTFISMFGKGKKRDITVTVINQHECMYICVLTCRRHIITFSEECSITNGRELN